MGTAGAYALLEFDGATRELSYALLVQGLEHDEVTHIFRGPPGQNGPLLHVLADKAFTRIEGRVKLSADDVEDLQRGLLYLTVQSREHPGGLVRGQIFLPGREGRVGPFSCPPFRCTGSGPSTAERDVQPTSPGVRPPITGHGGLLGDGDR